MRQFELGRRLSGLPASWPVLPQAWQPARRTSKNQRHGDDGWTDSMQYGYSRGRKGRHYTRPKIPSTPTLLTKYARIATMSQIIRCSHRLAGRDRLRSGQPETRNGRPRQEEARLEPESQGRGQRRRQSSRAHQVTIRSTAGCQGRHLRLAGDGRIHAGKNKLETIVPQLR